MFKLIFLLLLKGIVQSWYICSNWHWIWMNWDFLGRTGMWKFSKVWILSKINPKLAPPVYIFILHLMWFPLISLNTVPLFSDMRQIGKCTAVFHGMTTSKLTTIWTLCKWSLSLRERVVYLKPLNLRLNSLLFPGLNPSIWEAWRP